MGAKLQIEIGADKGAGICESGLLNAKPCAWQQWDSGGIVRCGLFHTILASVLQVKFLPDGTTRTYRCKACLAAEVEE